MVDYFGVEGEFVKEEYSDHMKRNYRYYKWISKDDPSHYIYVNFAEEEPGVYHGQRVQHQRLFRQRKPIEKYLDTVKAEAAEADKAATANAEDEGLLRRPSLSSRTRRSRSRSRRRSLTSGWSFDEGKRCLVENDDPTAFGAGSDPGSR